jgi:peroxiredoxin
MTKEKLTWRSFADPGALGQGAIATKWNLSATPTFYVLDHKGVIRHKWVGSPGEKAIDAALEKLIKEAEKREK